MATDTAKDYNAFAHSEKANRAWRPCAHWPSGSPKAWTSDGIVIAQTTNSAGLLAFKVKFRNGKTCLQATLADAEEYAEANAFKNVSYR